MTNLSQVFSSGEGVTLRNESSLLMLVSLEEMIQGTLNCRLKSLPWFKRRTWICVLWPADEYLDLHMNVVNSLSKVPLLKQLLYSSIVDQSKNTQASWIIRANRGNGGKKRTLPLAGQHNRIANLQTQQWKQGSPIKLGVLASNNHSMCLNGIVGSPRGRVVEFGSPRRIR